jgi:hypothetical protein
MCDNATLSATIGGKRVILSNNMKRNVFRSYLRCIHVLLCSAFLYILRFILRAKRRSKTPGVQFTAYFLPVGKLTKR